MVNLDLGALSAPIEALRPALNDAYQRLDNQWNDISSCLQSLPIPTNVSYTYSKFETDEFHPEDYSCLVWRKFNGKKRVCIEHNTYNPNNPYSEFDTTTIPYEEWSGEQRVNMLRHVPGLFEAAANATKAFIERTEQ